jgi:uracil-DNA glycosylase
MIQRSSADATIVREGLKHAIETERGIEPGGNLRASWEALLKDARKCTRCDLYKHATQTVFGEGPLDASIMFVGEQPGDQEDLAGRPFVGPAGALFDAALEKAGMDRSTIYVTNAVKHFKFTRAAGSKRRIHKTPSRTEAVACRPWLFAELTSVQPEVVVALGATAAQSLLGSSFRLTQHRGEQLHLPETDLDIDPSVVATPHPSSVLRGPPEDREKAYDALVSDLRFAADLLD